MLEMPRYKSLCSVGGSLYKLFIKELVNEYHFLYYSAVRFLPDYLKNLLSSLKTRFVVYKYTGKIYRSLVSSVPLFSNNS